MGDLKGICVFKFPQANVEYLLASRPPTELGKRGPDVEAELLYIDFYKVGANENFHADLKKYLKSLGR